MTEKERLADRIEEAMTEIIQIHKDYGDNYLYVKFVDFDYVDKVAKKHGFNPHYLMKIGNFINK